jgi:glycosyltransferase involved in cell wall biosynthesis
MVNISIFKPISTNYLFTNKKIAIVSVINDLVTDSRVKKICSTLLDCDYEVILIGRKLPRSLPMPALSYRCIRMKLFFKKGPFFYLFFNVRLFFKLLFSKANLLYANDLDTLLPNYLISLIKKIPLVYDSHELFCEVPELQNAPFKRKIWLRMEAWIVPKLKNCLTVNDSIAAVFNQKYHTTFSVVRNISPSTEELTLKNRKDLSLPLDKKIILLQGAGINMDRGAEELVDAMVFVDNALLLIIGSGDVWELLKTKIIERGLSNKIKLIDKLPKSDLMQYTFLADLGLSIDKNTNLNYFYSLPNKIFDYIHAGLPILASRLPEIEKIITTYSIGEFIENHEAKHLSEKINSLLSSPKLTEYRKNTFKAKQELNWEKEKLILQNIINAAEQN